MKANNEFNTNAEKALTNPIFALSFLCKSDCKKNPSVTADIFLAHRKMIKYFIKPLKSEKYAKAREVLYKIALKDKEAALKILASRYENTRNLFLTPMQVSSIILKHLGDSFNSLLDEIYQQNYGLTIIEKIFELCVLDSEILKQLSSCKKFTNYFIHEFRRFDPETIIEKLREIKPKNVDENDIKVKTVNKFIQYVIDNSDDLTEIPEENSQKRKRSGTFFEAKEAKRKVDFNIKTRSRRIHENSQSQPLSQHSQIDETDFNEDKTPLQKIIQPPLGKMARK